MAKNILLKSKYKSSDWANRPVIAKSLFREYDLRNPIKPMLKGGKEVPASINAEGFRVLGQAYGTYAQKKLEQKKIVVANDYRSYSRGLTYAFITGVLATGIDVVDIGTQLTPVLYFAQYHLDLPGGAMITASHNDNGWSGLKIAKGLSQTFGPDDIIEYKDLVYGEKFATGAGNYQREDGLRDDYIKDIVDKLKPTLGNRKLKIVISGGNGGGGIFLEKVLTDLGFTIIPVNNDPDWDFPHFNPNPEHLEFLRSLGKKVKAEQADLGLSIDGDGDRLGVVNNKGEEVFSDRIGLFIARYLVEDTQRAKQNIIIDVKSTGAYQQDSILKKQQTNVIFCKTGHSYVKTATQENDALAGFEKSGHFFLRDKYGRGYDDGVLSAAWVATILSHSDKSLADLLAEQPKSYQSPTLEPAVNNDKEKYEIVDQVIKYFQGLQKDKKKFAGLAITELITVNGIRFMLEGGAWGLVRASSNQPNLVITCESFNTRREMYDIMEATQEHLASYNIGEYDQEMPPYEDKK
ncbi:phosphomannomutase/phosphoglucomutase [Patescibacteria group bacterium]|nr:phosphomannomutase/phosphoglucomutase [Patescibacteria group bacterium]